MKEENNQDSIEETLCPIRYALSIIGGKWKLPILCLLSDGKPSRYNQIKKRLDGITNMMLSQSLKELEAYGVVHREQYNEIPPKVEYWLTDQGKTLLPTLTEMAKWGAYQMTNGKARNESMPVIACSSCQKKLDEH